MKHKKPDFLDMQTERNAMDGLGLKTPSFPDIPFPD